MGQEQTLVATENAVLGTDWRRDTDRMESEFWTKHGRHRVEATGPQSCSFPVEVFPPWLCRYVEEVAASCEVPVGVVGFVVLGMVSACFGTHLRVVVKNRYVPYCHDWFFLIAPVSLGKSPVFSHLSAPLRQVQDILRAAAEADAPDHDRKGDAPLVQVMVVDATPEALHKAQAENGGAMAMCTPETPLLSQLANTTKMVPLAGYLSSHSGEGFDTLRITRKADDIEAARLAIIAGTQTSGLKEVRQRPELESRGITARITYYVASAITEADLHDDDPEVSEELALRYEETLRELGLYYRGNTTEPLQFTPEAKAARDEWRNWFKRRHRLEGGDLHAMSDHCSKVEDKAIRWAALLSVLWAMENGGIGSIGTVSIDQDSWERALRIVDFDLHHYRLALNLIEQGPHEELAERLSSYFRGKECRTIRLRDLKRNCRPFGKADEKTRDLALQLLEEEGVIKLVETTQGTKPSPAVVVL